MMADIADIHLVGPTTLRFLKLVTSYFEKDQTPTGQGEFSYF
jgi:hypothetical protein